MSKINRRNKNLIKKEDQAVEISDKKKTMISEMTDCR